MTGRRPSRVLPRLSRVPGFRAAVAALLGMWVAAGASELVRSLPPYYRPGQPVAVKLDARPDGTVQAYSVEERLPSGWSAGGVTHGGVYDSVSGRLRWGPFFDGAARELAYTSTPPAGSTGERSFLATGQFGAAAVPASGDSVIAPAPSTVTGQLPVEMVPGSSILVFLAVEPAPGVAAYSVSDPIPPGWTATEMNHGGVLDGATRTVKWGPFTDGLPRTLQYRLGMPREARGAFVFEGRAVFDRDGVAVRGDRTINAADHSVLRLVPPAFLPGGSFDVSLRVTPLPFTTVFSVEEQLPPGWTPVSVVGPGTFDPATGRLKWGPIEGAAPVTYGYRVAAPRTATDPVSFSGRGVFDARQVPTLGVADTLPRRNSVTRTLPARFQPGTAFGVTLRVEPLPGTAVWAVEEAVPAGWSVDQISDAGVFDAVRRRIKWRQFDLPVARTLSYRALPPAGAVGVFAFDGIGAFDLAIVATGGDTVTVAGSRIERVVAAGFRPGETLSVTLRVTPVAGTGVHSVEEDVPEGWTAGAIGNGGVLDAANRRIKWGPFLDATPRNLGFSLTAPVSGPDLVALAGRGEFDTATVGTEGVTELQRLLNRAPFAFDDLRERAPGAVLRVRSEELLANDVDPDGPTLRLALPAAVSARGGTVALEDGWVVYTPPGSDPREDEFQYFAEDGRGGRALGRVTVRVSDAPPPAPTVLTLTPDGAAWVLVFQGAAGRGHRVEGTSSLVPPVPWALLGTVTAGSDGRGTFRDVSPPPGMRLYRVVAQP